jgi:hypothetical protein
MLKEKLTGILALGMFIPMMLPHGCSTTGSHQKGAANEKILMGSKASSYIGDLKEKFVGKPYTVKAVRWRGSEDIIAFVFNTYGGGIEFVAKRDDGIHFYSHLILDETNEGTQVTEENIQSYLNEINENKLKPFIILDGKSEEKAIIYTRTGYQIYSHINSKGELTIELSDNLSQGRNSLFQWNRGKK